MIHALKNRFNQFLFILDITSTNLLTEICLLDYSFIKKSKFIFI